MQRIFSAMAPQGDETERAGSIEQGSSEAGQPDEQPYDASDPSQVNQRNRDAKRRAIRHREVLGGIMSSSNGRAWLWDFLGGCHMFVTSYTSERTHDTAFNEGERNVGLRLNAEMQRFPEQYLLMLKENGKGL